MGKIPDMASLNPGIDPCEFNVLIAPEEIEEKTAGGIFLPDTKKETDQLAAMRGRLVAVSPKAGASIWPDDERRPKPGDAVFYAKYAGILVTGADGKEFRICKDKDVMGIFAEGGTNATNG